MTVPQDGSTGQTEQDRLAPIEKLSTRSGNGRIQRTVGKIRASKCHVVSAASFDSWVFPMI